MKACSVAICFICSAGTCSSTAAVCKPGRIRLQRLQHSMRHCDAAGSAARMPGEHLLSQASQLLFKAPSCILHNEIVRDVDLHCSGYSRGERPLVERISLRQSGTVNLLFTDSSSYGSAQLVRRSEQPEQPRCMMSRLTKRQVCHDDHAAVGTRQQIPAPGAESGHPAASGPAAPARC